MPANEVSGGNRGSADELLEAVGHAVVAVVSMQCSHDNQVGDEMIGLLQFTKFCLPDLWRHVEVLDAAAQHVAERLGHLGHRQRLGASEFVHIADVRHRIRQHGSGGCANVGCRD